MSTMEKDLLDAIEIIVDSKEKKATPDILFGLVKQVSASDNKCDVSINGKTHTIKYFGNSPTTNKTYPVFVPSSGMSRAFILVV